jgi:hypothetical protein
VSAVATPELTLADEVAKYYSDPLGFVMFAYPWGEPGPLANYEGPDDNQKEFLNSLGEEVKRRKFNGSEPVMPIYMSETSGHGTGKSVMGAWIANWILSTRPYSKGTVSAGSWLQLKNRTWAEIRRWTRLCITGHWFEVQSMGVYHKAFPEQWKVMAQSCKEENAQSFAGQHAADSTSWYLFDEASEVPDKVKETAEGGMTDGEPMMFAWGQPVRNSGWFYKVCFGKDKWENSRRVDSRTSRFTNKPLVDQWIKDYGIDSDFVKVRLLGLPPSADELQYIDKARIEAAMKRTVTALHDDPLIAGFDVSGGGKAWNVIRFRRGLDGKPADLDPIRIPGEKDPDRSQRVGLCAEILSDRRPGRQVAAMFVDAAFGAPIVERLKMLGFSNVYEVSFGSQSPDAYSLNMRAYMWKKAKDWLLLGSLPSDSNLPEEHGLATQLAIPGYHINNTGKLVIESKADIQERGEASPDDADAFCLTFAQPVAPIQQMDRYDPPPRVGVWS